MLTVIVLVLRTVDVFVVPRKQEQALLIFEVNGLPVPQPVAKAAGIVVVTARLLLLPPACEARVI